MLGHEPHLAAGRARRIDDEMRLDGAAEAGDRAGDELRRLVGPDDADEQAARAEAGEIARPLPAPPITFSSRRTAITGTGASGDTRDTSP